MTMNTTKDVLIAARKLVEQGWCQDVAARDKFGLPTQLKDLDATQYCTVGAIWRCGITTEVIIDALRIVEHVLDTKYIATWNDAPGRTKEQVLESFDKAIAAAGNK